MRFDIHKNIFARLFSVLNTISLSRHELVQLGSYNEWGLQVGGLSK